MIVHWQFGLEQALLPDAGEDGLLLAYSAAVEKILPPMPPPPPTPACLGCTPRVDIHEANYSGTGEPQLGDVTSIFSLHLDGACALKRSEGDINGEEWSERQCQSKSEL